MANSTIREGQGVRLSVLPGGSPPLVDLLAALEEHVKDVLGVHPVSYPRPILLPSRLTVPTGLIIPGRWQPRSVFADAELGDLAESIAAHGIINPLLVFVGEHGKFELIAGERRLRAAELAGVAMVPVEIVEGEPKKLHEISIIDNLQRENLRPWEEGAAFERMITELRISEAELARRMGKNRAYIQQRRALAGAAPELHQALARESISFGVVRGVLAGAAGDQAVQRAALLEVERLIKAGKPMVEATARKVATDAVVSVHTATVKGLGWKLDKHHSGHLVLWSDSERPRVVTEKELIDLVSSSARPGDGTAPAPWDEDEDIAYTLSQRGYLVSARFYEPWVCLSDSSGLSWWAGAELAERARLAQADLDRIETEAGLFSWDLRRVRSQVFFVRDDQRTQSAYDYAGLEKLLDQLKAGTASTFPRERCAQCDGWLDTGSSMYYGNWRIHTACKDAALEAERERITSPAASSPAAGESQQIAVEVPDWVRQMPEDAVRSLVAFFTDEEEAMQGSLESVRATFAEFVLVTVEQFST